MADTNHHDTGYKELFSYPEFVQQLIEGFAPSQMAELMDFSTLQNHSGNYITPLFDEKFEDVVWSVEVTWQGVSQQVFLYILLEFLRAYQPHLRYYLIDESRYTDEELDTRHTPLSVENAGGQLGKPAASRGQNRGDHSGGPQ